jgi:hypothetical protein
VVVLVSFVSNAIAVDVLVVGVHVLVLVLGLNDASMELIVKKMIRDINILYRYSTNIKFVVFKR